MGQSLGSIGRDDFPPFFSPAAYRTPFPESDRDPRAFARPCEPPHAYLIVSTPLTTTHGIVPTVYIVRRSPAEVTPA